MNVRLYCLEEKNPEQRAGRHYYRLVSHPSDILEVPDGVSAEFVRWNVSNRPDCQRYVVAGAYGQYVILETEAARNTFNMRQIILCISRNSEGKKGYIVEKNVPTIYNLTGQEIIYTGGGGKKHRVIPPAPGNWEAEWDIYDQEIDLGDKKHGPLMIAHADVTNCPKLPLTMGPDDVAICTKEYANAYMKKYGIDKRIVVPSKPYNPYTVEGYIVDTLICPF